MIGCGRVALAAGACAGALVVLIVPLALLVLALAGRALRAWPPGSRGEALS